MMCLYIKEQKHQCAQIEHFLLMNAMVKSWWLFSAYIAAAAARLGKLPNTKAYKDEIYIC